MRWRHNSMWSANHYKHSERIATLKWHQICMDEKHVAWYIWSIRCTIQFCLSRLMEKGRAPKRASYASLINQSKLPAISSSSDGHITVWASRSRISSTFSSDILLYNSAWSHFYIQHTIFISFQLVHHTIQTTNET